MAAVGTATLEDGREVEVYYDDLPESPREWSNTATFILSHGRYTMPDESDGRFSPDDYGSADEAHEALEELYDGALVLKVFGYEHGAMTCSTSPYSCPWDSGLLGFAVLTRESWAEVFGDSTPYDYKKATEIIDAEVKTFALYLEGQVFGWATEDDICSGYYGEDHLRDGIEDALGSKVVELA